MAIRGGRRPGALASALAPGARGPKSGLGTWLSRWHIIPRAALVALSITILTISNSTPDYNHADWSDIGFGPTIICWLWAATWPVLHAPATALPPILRLRARVRRSFYRASVGLLTLSLLLLTADAVFTLRADNVTIPDLPLSAADAAYARIDRWTAWAYTAVVWSQLTALVAACLPMLDPLAWRLWVRIQPSAVRDALRQGLIDGRAVKAVVETGKNGRRKSLMIVNSVKGKDRQRGQGRGRGHGHQPSEAAAIRPATEPVTVRPGKDSVPKRSADRKPWYKAGHLAWDGTNLVASSGRGTPLTCPVAPGGVDAAFAAEKVNETRSRPGSTGTNTGAVVEIAAITTSRGLRTGKPWRPGENIVALLLLDAESRRIASLPFTGLHATDVAALAKAAQIDFRTYLGLFEAGELGEILKAYFPKSVHYRRIHGPRIQNGSWWAAR